jgi:predicted amidophosphoribosyltransferase
MECPHCHKDIPGRPCSVCGKTTPLEGKYCMECGSPLGEEGPTEGDEAFDLDNRVLCPDGTCTGIIVDGRCTECGKQI